jgi:uncharacterized phosphosugar-binding protein
MSKMNTELDPRKFLVSIMGHLAACLSKPLAPASLASVVGLLMAAVTIPPVYCAETGPAEQYIDGQIRVVRSLETKCETIAEIADEAARRLRAGGTIRLAGEKGMMAELAGRAGGLCGAKVLSLETAPLQVGPDDLVLLSDYGSPGRLKSALEKLVATKALVIVFASAENPLLRPPLAANLRVIPVDIPLDSRMLVLRSGGRIIPLASPAIATAQWTFVAELLGACRRHHRQLAVYLSIWLDPGLRRYKRTQGLLFEPDLRPDPVARGQYAHAFLASAGQSLKAVRTEELPAIRQAAAWLRNGVAAHRRIVRTLEGHLPEVEAGNGGEEHYFSRTISFGDVRGEKWIQENFREGDIFLFLGYQENEDARAATTNALGARTMFVTSAAPSAQQAKNPRHLYVNPHWPRSDACLELSGYDVKACPLSGILGLTCYYAICAEMIGNE